MRYVIGAYYNPNELRASSSGFQWGQLTFTTYKTACLRKILIQSRGFESSIDPKYKILGDFNEARHEERLKLDSRKRYLKEYPFKSPIVTGLKGMPEITLSGHIDFLILNDEGMPESLDELKSVSSPNVYRTVIKGGEYLIENLAQTINYMVSVRVVQARLIYTFYKKMPDLKGVLVDKAMDERIFAILIDDYGRIHVDGKPTRWCVGDQLAHRIAAAKAIQTGVVPQRPQLWDAPFASPCAYCPFTRVCDDWDSGLIESDETFVNICMSIGKKDGFK